MTRKGCSSILKRGAVSVIGRSLYLRTSVRSGRQWSHDHERQHWHVGCRRAGVVAGSRFGAERRERPVDEVPVALFDRRRASIARTLVALDRLAARDVEDDLALDALVSLHARHLGHVDSVVVPLAPVEAGELVL